MTSPRRLFWGDTHHNTFQHGQQAPCMEDILAWAGTYLDFYTGAYYTAQGQRVAVRDDVAPAEVLAEGGHPCENIPGADVSWNGIRIEETKRPERIAEEWEAFQRATANANRSGTFVAFPGFEWQGDGSCGDRGWQ